jgi:DNA polymerase (family 10)
VDWRYGPVLRDSQALVSINPDAHEVAGLQDTRYGIAVARKALLPATQVVNAGSVEAVEKWLKRG